jgi:hypothetical protein
MSKSKSRHLSKQTSGSSKNGANGVAKLASAANRTTAKTDASVSTTVEEKQPAAKPIPAASATTKSVPLTPNTGKAQTRDAAKYERRQAERQMRYLAQRRARRNRIIIWTSAILILAVIGGLVTYFVYQSQHAGAKSTSNAPYTEPIYDSSYPPIDNVYCDSGEQLAYHIHVHVSIYINGQPSPIPQYVGIPTDQQSGQATCFYWLHTHDTSGVIHIESPVNQIYTFGQFLDEWNQGFQSLGFPSQLLLTSGWTIWVNGQPYHGSLRNIPLNAHTLITLAFNSPNAKPDTTYNWGNL